MGAEVARYLSYGLATSTSVWARARHPCRSRSESKVPHTLCYVRNHSAMVSKRCSPTPALAIRRAYLSESTVLKFTHEAEGVWCLVSGPYETGSRVRAPMDGFTACPETRHCTTSAPMLIKICRAKLTQSGSIQLALPAIFLRTRVVFSSPSVFLLQRGRVGLECVCGAPA